MLNSPKIRRQAIGIGAVVLLAVLVGFFLFNLWHNVQRLNLPIGFGFLRMTAGFDIPFTLIHWDVADTFGRAILIGLLNTLLVFGLGVTLATVAGFVAGLMQLSPNALMRGTARLYVEVLRNTPALMQVIFLYLLLLQNTPPPRQAVSFGDLFYLSTRGLTIPSVRLDDMATAGLTAVVAVLALLAAVLVVRRFDRAPGWLRSARLAWALVGVAAAALAAVALGITVEPPVRTAFAFRGGATLTPELVALTVGLSAYFSAFIAEIVRAGVLSVPTGAVEAAQALALRPAYVLRFVTLPLALRVILPPLTSQYLNIAKATSLGVAIAFPDVVQVLIGSILNRTGHALELMGITMLVFLVISLVIALVMNVYNRAKAIVTR